MSNVFRAIDDFQGREGQSFRVFGGDWEVLLELVEVTDSRHLVEGMREPPKRTPFSLLFSGPDSPALVDCLQDMQHEELGEFQVYVSQKQPESSGRRYEVVFN